jgi:hypothetical protein
MFGGIDRTENILAAGFDSARPKGYGLWPQHQVRLKNPPDNLKFESIIYCHSADSRLPKKINKNRYLAITKVHISLIRINQTLAPSNPMNWMFSIQPWQREVCLAFQKILYA